jgi:ABC-type transport system involved in multi-copper enzyme maturation permease subunit
MYSLWTLARATYRDIAHRPLFHIVTLLLAALILCSPYVTLFSFGQELHFVREMGVATFPLFVLILAPLLSHSLVTEELEDRTAVTLLAKPVRRSHFLIGRYLGLFAALSAGVLLLGLILLLTLWLSFDAKRLYDARYEDLLSGSMDTWGCIAAVSANFARGNGILTAQGTLLGILECGLITALTISLCAFLPAVASVATAAFLFILGNLSAYMLGAVERSAPGLPSGAARLTGYLLPNFGYFNLQTFSAEGKILSGSYLLFTGVYAFGYAALVLAAACALFERRDIR